MTGKGKHKVLQLPATITGSTEDNQRTVQKLFFGTEQNFGTEQKVQFQMQ